MNEASAEGALSRMAMGAKTLDLLAAMLPLDARHTGVLSDSDATTLTYLAKQGMGPNTIRALLSDLHYLETWAQAATAAPLPWPAPKSLILKFIAHHLYKADERARDASHGMPEPVVAALMAQQCLRTQGPHAPATVRRRLALWSTMHRWQGLEGVFGAADLRHALRLAVRAADRAPLRKSANPVTRDILDRLLATCASDRLVDQRDCALLLVAFGSGGRRRSEIARLRLDDLVERPPVQADPDDPTGPLLPALSLRLGRTKTTGADQDERVLLIGRPVTLLKAWLAAARIKDGAIFRAIDRWGHVGDQALDGQSVNAIVKSRCAQADLPVAAFSAHGLRSGYLTEAARRGVPIQEAMQQSRHRSIQQASRYYNEVTIERGKAARLG